jgi:hypothetical protein
MKAAELIATGLCAADAFTWTAMGHIGIGVAWIAGIAVALALSRWRG